MKRGDLTQVASMVAAGVIGGMIVAAVRLLPGADTGDWLAFFGSLLGAALGVAGAYVVAVMQFTRAQRKASYYLLALCVSIDETAKRLLIPFEPDPDHPEPFLDRRAQLFDAIDSLKWDSLQLGDAELQRTAGVSLSLQACRRILNEIIPQLDYWRNPGAIGNSQQRLVSAINEIGPNAKMLRAVTDKAIDSLQK